MATKFDPTAHALVPKHSKVSEKDRKELFAKYQIEAKDLPRMLVGDPAIAHLGVKEGDIVKVDRRSPTSGASVFYRRVVSA